MSTRAALTLIEVVAALTLLAAVAVGVLLTQARSLHTCRLSKDRAEAWVQAEQLAARWETEPQPATEPDSGVLKSGWQWKREVQRVRCSAGGALDWASPEMVVVRLTVARADSKSAEPLAAVEWLIDPLRPRQP